MQQPHRREHERYEVRLQVQFVDAKAFVEQYAYNISQGGLFVTGVADLKLEDQLTVQLQLPGTAPQDIVCRVAHVIEGDEVTGRQAGAGLAIVEAPDEFTRALRDYLRLLSKRHESVVFIDGNYPFSEPLSRVGYEVQPAPSPDDILDAVEETLGVVGVIATGADANAYRDAMRDEELHNLVIEVLPDASFESVLNAVDRRIATRPSRVWAERGGFDASMD